MPAWHAAARRVYEAEDVRRTTSTATRRRCTWREGGAKHECDCDFIAGCDGFHGVSRASVPAGARQRLREVYPFGWLGILVDTPPVSDELSMPITSAASRCARCARSRAAATTSSARWRKRSRTGPTSAFWDELRRAPRARDGCDASPGPSIEKNIAPLRSFVAEPMRFGRLFLAGDAAHIVPPTGAKGLNLAASDVTYLSTALIAYYEAKRTDLLDRYSETALRRIWAAVRFSWWFTSISHKFNDDPIEQRSSSRNSTT